MANTFYSHHCHLVFSTKKRKPFLTGDLMKRVWSYLGGIAREHDCKVVVIGGVADHVHLLLEIPPKHAVSKVVQAIKGGSSKWVHETFPDMNEFGWQDGYGLFSVSKSILPQVIQYIENQEQHHADKSFETEFRQLLERHEIRYDDRYLFD